MTCCAPVPEAATSPDRARRDRVREAEADAADDRGAAVRAQHQQVTLGRQVLKPDLLLDGDVVGKDHHVTARVERVGRLGERVLPRHRDERQARSRSCGPRSALSAAVARLRRPSARPAGASARCRRPRARWPATRRHRPRSRRAGRLGLPSAGAAMPRPASRSRFRLGAHRDHRGLHSGDGLGLGGDLHQRHGVRVSAGSGLDMLHGSQSSRLGSADGDVDAGGVVHQRLRPAVSAGRPRRSAGRQARGPSPGAAATVRARPWPCVGLLSEVAEQDPPGGQEMIAGLLARRPRSGRRCRSRRRSWPSAARAVCGGSGS